MLRTDVPEAPVDEDCHLSAGEDEVCPAAPKPVDVNAVVYPIPQPPAVKFST